jgi:hypothetical protein
LLSPACCLACYSCCKCLRRWLLVLQLTTSCLVLGLPVTCARIRGPASDTTNRPQEDDVRVRSSLMLISLRVCTGARRRSSLIPRRGDTPAPSGRRCRPQSSGSRCVTRHEAAHTLSQHRAFVNASGPELTRNADSGGRLSSVCVSR